MAFDQTLLGTIGNDNLLYSGLGNTSFFFRSLQGDDQVIFDTDVKLSSLNLDGGNDNLLITSTSTVNPTLLSSTIQGGGGADVIRIRTRTGADNFIFGDLGNDTIQLSAVTGNNASYVRTQVWGDNGTDEGGIDTVYIDNSVAAFNQSIVDLGNNDNGLFIGPVSNAVIDALAKGTPLNLLTLGLEGLLVQSGQFDQSTVRGGAGSDWIVFDSLFNPFAGAAGTSDLSRSSINGNAGDDAIAILRNTDRTSIQGGQGDDFINAFSGTMRSSVFNGNLGADTVLVGTVLSQATTYYGGQGDDTLNIFSGVADNSVFSGDRGNDKINFFAANTTGSTLRGGDGDDQIDDFSSAITSLGTVIDGGTGDDELSQAANIVLPSVTDFGSTMIGGQGADVMTGDLNTQPLGRKEYDGAVDIDGASRDLFRFSFGDSVINAQGVGHDEITDFDSNSSFYIDAAGNPTVPSDYNFRPDDGVINALDDLQRDQIELTNTNIKVGISKTIDIGGGVTVNVNVNNRGLSNANNITDFIQAGVLQDEGAAILFNQFPDPFTPGAPFDVEQFRASWLFISDGSGDLSDGDLLIELRNVAFDPDSVNAGMILDSGRIVDFQFA